VSSSVEFPKGKDEKCALLTAEGIRCSYVTPQMNDFMGNPPPILFPALGTVGPKDKGFEKGIIKRNWSHKERFPRNFPTCPSLNIPD
jgi:hypothetical protein